jgi:molybdate transport system substrate-binding protein
LGLCWLAGCGSPQTAPVTLFAAASTRDALHDVIADFQNQTGTRVELNTGASSTLARQIEEGAGADLFLSADEAWADHLVDCGLVAERRDLLSNRLVVIVPAEHSPAVNDLADLAGPAVTRLALAGPSVPAGRYARQALTKAGLWERLKDRVRQGGDVRATLAYVVRGEADAGVVYATDARGSSAVRVAVRIKEDLHTPIRYPLVLVRREAMKPEARSLYDYLHSEAAAAVFRRYGFDLVP